MITEFQVTSNDCYGQRLTNDPYTKSFNATSDTVNLANGSDYRVHTYLPFLLAGIKQGAIITAATLYWTATANRTATWLDIYGDNAGNSAVPASYDDLAAKPWTTAALVLQNLSYSNGVEYSVNVTSIIQEIVNRGDYAPGNRVAIMVKSVDAGTLQVALSEHATVNGPRLVVNFVSDDGFPQVIVI